MTGALAHGRRRGQHRHAARPPLTEDQLRLIVGALDVGEQGFDATLVVRRGHEIVGVYIDQDLGAQFHGRHPKLLRSWSIRDHSVTVSLLQRPAPMLQRMAQMLRTSENPIQTPLAHDAHAEEDSVQTGADRPMSLNSLKRASPLLIATVGIWILSWTVWALDGAALGMHRQFEINARGAIADSSGIVLCGIMYLVLKRLEGLSPALRGAIALGMAVAATWIFIVWLYCIFYVIAPMAAAGRHGRGQPLDLPGMVRGLFLAWLRQAAAGARDPSARGGSHGARRAEPHAALPAGSALPVQYPL